VASNKIYQEHEREGLDSEHEINIKQKYFGTPQIASIRDSTRSKYFLALWLASKSRIKYSSFFSFKS